MAIKNFAEITVQRHLPEMSGHVKIKKTCSHLIKGPQVSLRQNCFRLAPNLSYSMNILAAIISCMSFAVYETVRSSICLTPG